MKVSSFMLPKERAPMRRKTAMAVGPWMPDFLGESLDAARRNKDGVRNNHKMRRTENIGRKRKEAA